jgi:hypothetical protein
LVAATLRRKSWVVVPPSVTTMLVAVLELRPGKLAVALGYVPAGRSRNV